MIVKVKVTHRQSQLSIVPLKQLGKFRDNLYRSTDFTSRQTDRIRNEIPHFLSFELCVPVVWGCYTAVEIISLVYLLTIRSFPNSEWFKVM